MARSTITADKQQRPCDPQIVLEVKTPARRGQAKQPNTIRQAAQIRIVIFHRATIELGGKRKPGFNVERNVRTSVQNEVWAQLVNFGNEALFDVAGVVPDQLRLTQNTGQVFQVIFRIRQIGCSAGQHVIACDRRQAEIVVIVAGVVHSISTTMAPSKAGFSDA